MSEAKNVAHGNNDPRALTDQKAATVLPMIYDPQKPADEMAVALARDERFDDIYDRIGDAIAGEVEETVMRLFVGYGANIVDEERDITEEDAKVAYEQLNKAAEMYACEAYSSMMAIHWEFGYPNGSPSRLLKVSQRCVQGADNRN